MKSRDWPPFSEDKKKENVNWEYDDEADVLYISIGKPKPAEKGERYKLVETYLDEINGKEGHRYGAGKNYKKGDKGGFD